MQLPDTDSPGSPNPKHPLLPIVNPLSPAELESFRQEMRLAHAELKVLAKRAREERLKSRAASPNLKPPTLPVFNLLSPSEIESLRQEFNLAQNRLAILVAEKRKNRIDAKEANSDDPVI